MNKMELSLLSKPFGGMNDLAVTDATNSLFTAKFPGSDQYILQVLMKFCILSSTKATKRAKNRGENGDVF